MSTFGQDNDSDCGVFVLEYVERFAKTFYQDANMDVTDTDQDANMDAKASGKDADAVNSETPP